MKTLYHGTTLDNWEKIQKEGWNGPSRKTVWECSLEEVYFYDLDKSEYEENACIRDAFSSAQVAAAVQDYRGDKLVVIRVEIPDEYVDDDYSCENMYNIASVVQVGDIQPKHITAVWVSENYYPSMRMIYVASLLSYNHQIRRNTFNALELRIAEKLDDFLEEILEFDWQPLTTQE